MSGVGVIEREAPDEPGMEVPRVLGDVTRGAPGPTVVALGGIHGNERGGVHAARAVARRLESGEVSLRGRFLALAGNLGALGAGVRFLGCDLNRCWGEPVGGAPGGAFDGAPELQERDELLAVLREAIASSGDDLVLVDLHSSSAVGGPFVFLSDTLRNRGLAEALGVPIILGVEETIHGSLLEWLQERGHACVAIEGGQHDDPRTARHHEAAIWSLLVAAGAIDADAVPELPHLRAELRDAAAGHAGFVEVVHRHPVEDGDGFRMEPGFENFDPVREGHLLARDETGELRSPCDGLLLLPLYQGQGDDGYFVGREVRRRWLRLSAVLRRVGLARVLPFLPGVRRDPSGPHRLAVDRHVARAFPREVLHLLGFRLVDATEDVLVFERRPETPADSALS